MQSFPPAAEARRQSIENYDILAKEYREKLTGTLLKQLNDTIKYGCNAVSERCENYGYVESHVIGEVADELRELGYDVEEDYNGTTATISFSF